MLHCYCEILPLKDILSSEYEKFFSFFLCRSFFSSLFFLAISSSPFLRFSVATFAYVGSLGNQFPAVSVQFHRADIPIHYAAHAAHTRFSFARERARCIRLAARGAPNDRRTRTGHSERYRWQDIVNLQESHGFYLMRSNAQFPDGLLTFPTVFLSRTCVTLLRHLLV